MKKKILIIGIIIAIIAVIAGLFAFRAWYYVGEEEIVLITDTKNEINDEYDEIDVFMNELYGQTENSEETEYDFQKIVMEKSIVTFNGNPTINDTSVKCTVEYYDVYQYVMDNEETLFSLDTDDLYATLVSALESGKIKKNTVELELSAEYKDGKLIVNNDCYEYSNAITGGSHQLFSELYSRALQEYLK